MENQQLIFPSRQCSSTTIGLVKDFLAKNHVTIENYPYSSGLAPADFYLFPRLTSALKERRICDATEILGTRWKS
jgi:hypothetical protein